MSGIKRLKPLISQSEIDKAKIWEAKDNAERLRKGGRGKGGDVEMQELLLGDEELRNPYWNVEDIIAEDDFPYLLNVILETSGLRQFVIKGVRWSLKWTIFQQNRL